MSCAVHLLPCRRLLADKIPRRSAAASHGKGHAQRLSRVKEFFFDDDTFTAYQPRAREIANSLETGMTWSCNARANVNYERSRPCVTTDCGAVVGYESGNQQISITSKGSGSKSARIHPELPEAWDYQSRHLHPWVAWRNAETIRRPSSLPRSRVSRSSQPRRALSGTSSTGSEENCCFAMSLARR